ncbi:hypothetical protein BH09ACT1_BH09ACT1_28370 [soil metagenome]
MTDLVWRRGAEPGIGDRKSAGSVSKWRRGTARETVVSSTLVQLGSEWTVLQGSECGANGVDYVIVGPAGIFAVNTTMRGGKNLWVDESVIWSNGKPTSNVNDVRLGALAVSSRLTVTTGEVVPVTPVIVVPNPKSISFGGDAAKRTAVVSADMFTRWLVEGPRELSDEAIAYFTMVVEERDTWAVAV